MRTILFRGKCLDNGEWVEGGYYLEPYTSNTYIVCWNSFGLGYIEYIKVDPETVGQFTNQHDTCGDRIFEGDIVYCASEDENAEIKWDEETSRFVIEFFGWISDFDSFYGRDFEVVGNIYDEEE